MAPSGRPPMRRRVTGEVPIPNIPMPPAPSRAGALSPLNPKARVPSGLTSLMGPNNVSTLPSNLNPNAALTHAQRQRRPLELSRK